jgi:hypothetical protein
MMMLLLLLRVLTVAVTVAAEDLCIRVALIAPRLK